MGRYRPARPRGARYITPEGAERLRRELEHLWRVKRPQVTRSVAEAAAQGDRSENAEYIYGKKQLAEIDRRVRYLQKRLDELIVVDRRPEDERRVFFGAWVELEDETGMAVPYRIVGPDELDPGQGWISVDSPLGRALIGYAQGDEVEVEVPGGTTVYLIRAVRYADPDTV